MCNFCMQRFEFAICFKQGLDSIVIPLIRYPLILGTLFIGVQPLTGRTAENAFSYFRSDAGRQVGTGPLPARLEDPQALNWRIDLDSGHSTPVIRGGKIFLTTYR